MQPARSVTWCAILPQQLNIDIPSKALCSRTFPFHLERRRRLDAPVVFRYEGFETLSHHPVMIVRGFPTAVALPTDRLFDHSRIANCPSKLR
jgi:hypothetical protein